MIADVEKKFAVEITYNGLEKSFKVEPEERISALLQYAIAAFGITQNAHVLGLFLANGTELGLDQSVGHAGLKPGELLLLRPSTVRGGSARLSLSGGILTETYQILRDCGRGESECVAYWTGATSEAAVDRVEHPIHTSSPFGFEVESTWLTDFWKRLAASKRSIKAQVHTHPGRAFHSATDDRWPIVSQAGFLSIVIPNFAAGKPSLGGAWVGRLQAGGDWLRLVSAAEALELS